MRHETFRHPCPEPECEDGEVTLEYDAGRSFEDFYLIPDEEEVRCSAGCGPFPAKVFQAWYEGDLKEMGEREQDRADSARELYLEAKLERQRLGEDA